MDDLRVVSQLLFDWYHKNQRKLPWREFGSAYEIWISEIMLQQTTTTAVIPFFKRFLKRFPTIDELSKGPLEDVLEAWSGLGYYSRARNLYKTAQLIVANKGFPKTHIELMKYPGLGPYTARAISSIAFAEKVGVLDGNVIRVLSRLFAIESEWWKAKHRKELQSLADSMCQFDFPSSEINQSLMDLGASVCAPQSPDCISCPLSSVCQAFKFQNQKDIPIKKPKKKSSLWLWEPIIHFQNNKILLVKNKDLPFLKNQWVLPGKLQSIDKKPESCDFKHHITHNNIYVRVQMASYDYEGSNAFWCLIDEIKKHSHSSLISKCLKHSLS